MLSMNDEQPNDMFYIQILLKFSFSKMVDEVIDLHDLSTKHAYKNL